MPSFKAQSEITTWLYAIAARVMLRTRARLHRHAPVPLPADPIDPALGSPSADLERLELAQRLWQTVATLEPRQALAVELFYRRDLPVEEISRILSVPTGTTKTLLHRARQKLKSLLHLHPQTL